MSCLYKYKGKDYTKDEFYSLVRTTMVQPRTVQKYEKVLFPNGNTISKIEHFDQILEKIKEFDNKIEILKNSTIDDYVKTDELDNGVLVYKRKDNQSLGYSTLQISKDFTFEDNIQESINKLEKDKSHYENTEQQRLGTINFYENTITNILNKIYGKENVKQITDEYGNTWNEVIIVPERDLSQIQFQQSNQLIPTQQSETYDYVFEKLFENFNPYVTELTTDRKRAQEILNGYDTVQYQDKKIEKDELKIDMAEKINDINRNKEIENQIKQFNNDDANSYWSLSTNEEEIKRILKFKYPLLDFVIINEYLDLDNFDNSQVLKAKIKVEPYKNIFYGQTHANLHLDIFQIEDVESEHIVKSLDSLLNKTDDTMPIYINDRIYYRINDSIFKSGPIRLQYNNFDIISDSEFDRLKEITDIAFEEISSDDFLYLDDMLYYMENNIADDLNQQTRGKIALLKDIKEKSPVEYYSILAKYLINSLPLLYDESFSFGNYSQSNTYNPQNDALSYSIEYRNYIPVLLHELMHNFQTPDTAYTHKEEEFINKITELYKMAVGQVLDNYFDLPFDYYRNYSEVVGKDGKSYYGLVNINEFIAESMTNPEFQRYLSTIKTNNGKSVFEEIYDAVVKLIKSLLNEDISTESNLLIDTIDTIVDFMEKHNIHENVGKELMWDRWKVDIINKDPSMTYDIWQSLTNKEKLQIINCL